MGNIVAQNASTDVICGPFVNIYGSTIADLAIANSQIVLVKEGGVSAARSDTKSATSAAPGMQNIGLNATDTNTLGTITIWVSASAMMPYAKQIEVWNSVTWNAFYGADPLLGSAATSVLIQGALVNRDVLTSAGASALVTVVVKNVFTNMDVATSTGVSALVSIVGSAVAGRALTNYQALTSAAASALISVVVNNALVLGDIATSAKMSILISTLNQLALVNYDVPTSADISAIVSIVTKNALVLGDVATSAGMSVLLSAMSLGSAAASGIVGGAMRNIGLHMIVTESASVAGMHKNSIIARTWATASASGYNRQFDSLVALAQTKAEPADITTALTNWDAPTSADISAIVGNAVWNFAGSEPATAPDWGSVSRGTGFDWLIARSLNRHSQTTGTIEVYSSAGSVIASASVSNNSVSATRDQFRG